MTGYVSKRQAAWDKYSTNNRYGTLQWEAFESGWNAALAQPEQESNTISTEELIYMTGVYDGKVLEREACAKVAQETICDTHIPTGINIYGTRAAKAIRARENT